MIKFHQGISIYLLITLIILLANLEQSACNTTNADNKMVSKIKTDKYFVSKDVDPSVVFSIDATRISTNIESQASKCRVQHKQIKTTHEFEKFRVGSDVSREKSVYESLTTISDNAHGIQSFEILGDHILVILSNGTGYFLKNNRKFQPNPQVLNLRLELYIDKQNKNDFKFIPKIAKINGNAFVGTPKQIAYCEPIPNKCTILTGYKGVDQLYNFFAFVDKASSKQFLYLLTKNTMEAYELTDSASLINHQEYSNAFFGNPKIFIEHIVHLPQNKILVLDYYTGLIQIDHEPGAINKLVQQKVKNVYEQYGCMHMTVQKQASYVALECSLTRKSYFLLQLVKQPSFGTYSAHQPIFFNERLTGIGSNNQIVMGHIFSGVKLFWASQKVDHSYPYDYQKAGSIFLHNAKDAEISQLDGRTVIYICTEEQLRVYELSIVNPSVICYSLVPIEEEYKLKYLYACNRTIQDNICQSQKDFSYNAWEHKQIEITTTILPLIVSAILVAIVGYFLFKLYKKYERDVQAAKIKYNTDGNQFGLD